MSLLAGSMYFTTSLPVARAPVVPFIPCGSAPEPHTPKCRGTESDSQDSPPFCGHKKLKTNKRRLEGRSLVIPCFNIQPKQSGCLERSDLLTVTAAGAHTWECRFSASICYPQKGIAWTIPDVSELRHNVG